ncbi:hypothetical protein [Nonomuraea sp. NEAU-A123]|uniref:hypothetical protein n=1 Tax=Nonomuraea sp. NEAU-A123 TaxID=2839649 RepID=UPI001BE43DCD|nr:hypothetical protein [Nonomuraea sp. NEAU-A123]MBT2233552.1 hypothetical protein [Nonomuraea sp. NEAU-A123]
MTGVWGWDLLIGFAVALLVAWLALIAIGERRRRTAHNCLAVANAPGDVHNPRNRR